MRTLKWALASVDDSIAFCDDQELLEAFNQVEAGVHKLRHWGRASAEFPELREKNEERARMLDATVEDLLLVDFAPPSAAMRAVVAKPKASWAVPWRYEPKASWADCNYGRYNFIHVRDHREVFSNFIWITSLVYAEYSILFDFHWVIDTLTACEISELLRDLTLLKAKDVAVIGCDFRFGTGFDFRRAVISAEAAFSADEAAFSAEAATIRPFDHSTIFSMGA